MGIFTPNKRDFKRRSVIRDKEGHSIMIKRSIHQEDRTIVNVYVPKGRLPSAQLQVSSSHITLPKALPSPGQETLSYSYCSSSLQPLGTMLSSCPADLEKVRLPAAAAHPFWFSFTLSTPPDTVLPLSSP